MQEIQASEFKAKFSEIIQQVQEDREEYMVVG